MFKQQRETRQANRRHSQLMGIANGVVQGKTWGSIRTTLSGSEIDELTELFTGRAFAARQETVDKTEASNYITAALARRGVTAPSNI